MRVSMHVRLDSWRHRSKHTQVPTSSSAPLSIHCKRAAREARASRAMRSTTTRSGLWPSVQEGRQSLYVHVYA